MSNLENLGRRAAFNRSVVASSLGAFLLVGCSEYTPHSTTEQPLTGAYATQSAGHFFLDLCFKSSNGALNTIDLQASNEFFAGRHRIAVQPELVQENVPNKTVTTAFHSRQSASVPEILAKIHNGSLEPYTDTIQNASANLTCQKEFSGSLPPNFLNNIVEVKWNGSEPMDIIAPTDGIYHDHVPYDQIALQ
jgi:hypothetical protein